MLEENSPVMVKYESYLGWWNKNSIAFFKQMFSVFNDFGQNNILLVLSFIISDVMKNATILRIRGLAPILPICCDLR